MQLPSHNASALHSLSLISIISLSSYFTFIRRFISLTRLPALLLCRISPFGAFRGQPAYAQALISAGVPTIYVSVSSEKSTIMPTDAMSEQHSNSCRSITIFPNTLISLKTILSIFYSVNSSSTSVISIKKSGCP